MTLKKKTYNVPEMHNKPTNIGHLQRARKCLGPKAQVVMGLMNIFNSDFGSPTLILFSDEVAELSGIGDDGINVVQEEMFDSKS